MAEILIKAVDAMNPDPDVDARGCYKTGMPVVVAEDGHQWGARETLPSFWVLKLPGTPIEDVQPFLEPYQQQTGTEPDGVTPIIETIRPRRYQFDTAQFPAAAISDFGTTGVHVSTWAAFQPMLIDLSL